MVGCPSGLRVGGLVFLPEAVDLGQEDKAWLRKKASLGDEVREASYNESTSGKSNEDYLIPGFFVVIVADERVRLLRLLVESCLSLLASPGSSRS